MDTNLLQAYLALFIMAVIPIYIGAHRSLTPQQLEVITSKDAYLFPILGSVVLFSMYLVFKFLPKYYVNLLMSVYFTVFGVMALKAALQPVIASILPRHLLYKKNKTRHKRTVRIPFVKAPVEVVLDLDRWLAWAVASLLGLIYLITKHWVTNNVLGEAFSIVSIELISLGSFKIGCILLTGLFFYDIFWVFGTDVMVTVAKNFDAPIKVIWPRDETGFSLLGLGDIVIPGIFIALMLRFDMHLAKLKVGDKTESRVVNNKTYFKASFIGYVIGLVSTISVLHIFRAGQPALLYIVPAVIGAVLVTAIAKRDVKKLLQYQDEALTQQQENKTEEAAPPQQQQS